MSSPLLIALVLGVSALGLGYIAMASYTTTRPGRAAWGYWGLVLPGAFTALLAGIWGLHKQPALLNEGSVRAILVGVVALILMDYACFRSIRGDFPFSARTRALIPAAGAFILGGIVIVGIARSGSG